MTDICKCSAKECPLSSTCFRYLAEASEYQSYFIIEKPNKDCEHYWPVKDDEELKQLNFQWRD